VICFGLAVYSFTWMPVRGDEKGTKNGVTQATSSILIEATPKFVWNAVHVERERDPDIAYSKVLENSGNTKLLEQKFVNVPIFGSVTAVTRQIEEPERKIEYSLVRSDKFKTLSGSWDLSPLSDGKRTMLTLRSTLNVGFPFSSHLMKGTAKKKLERRLERIKRLAENEQNAFSLKKVTKPDTNKY